MLISLQYPCSDEGKKSMVIVTAVTLNSPAYDGGIHTGDILQKIENITVTSVSQANKLIKNARGLRLEETGGGREGGGWEGLFSSFLLFSSKAVDHHSETDCEYIQAPTTKKRRV